MTKNIENQFIYGTQYYRAPTPLPNEWEHDIAEIDKTGIDTIQLRVQWRKNEPREGEYYFDDIDRLFELAQKYDRKVLFKFLMENAPDYIYEKYNAQRIDMNGSPMNPGAHGAYYIGGWLPCFDNPDVVRRAEKFVKVMVERYKDKENLILWNIWNEPRSRPIGECGCNHSVQAYRLWLRERFKTIDALNEAFGKGWESFDTVRPPAMPHDYAELYLWRMWSLKAVTGRLAFMSKAVKSLDSVRPVVSHVGCCSVLQDIAGDGSDDLENVKELDFYGTSFPWTDVFEDLFDQNLPMLICDWLRNVSEYFWVYELYPDWGDWGKKVTIDNFRYKVMSALACGTKGIVYWQYRAERLGLENDLAGLVNIDSSFKPISHESANIAEFIRDNEDFLCRAKVQSDDIAILYNRESDMINRIENTGNGGLWNFDCQDDEWYGYKKALFGAYMMFRELGYTPNWIDSRQLAERLKGIKVLYLPECFIISPENVKELVVFAKNGGLIIAEEGLGLRQSNTWLNYPWPSESIRELFGVKIAERVSVKKGNDAFTSEEVSDLNIPAGEYISYLENTDSTAMGYWSDGRIAITQKGNACFVGTSLGSSFFDNHQEKKVQYIELLKKLLCKYIQPPITYASQGIYLRILKTENEKMLFVFNRANKNQTIEFDGHIFNVKAKESTAFRYQFN